MLCFLTIFHCLDGLQSVLHSSADGHSGGHLTAVWPQLQTLKYRSFGGKKVFTSLACTPGRRIAKAPFSSQMIAQTLPEDEASFFSSFV